MKLRHVYLILCILGFVFPYYALLPFMQINGADIVLMFQQVFERPGTAFFGYDLLVFALAGIVFVIVEGRKKKVPHYWIPILSMLFIGAGFGFPLFLYMREVNKN